MNHKSYIGPIDPMILLGIIVALAAFQLSQSVSGGVVNALLDKDFANYWLSGQLVAENQTSTLFGDLESYMAALTAHLGPQVQPRYWSYPPHLLFFTAPLGLFDYFPAMALFMFGSLVLFLFGAWVWLGKLDANSLILLSPFILFNLIAGQNGFLTGGIMLLGLGWRYSRPLLAGIAFGALTIKPQLGILIPFLLLVERRYFVIVCTVATTFLLVSATILVFGSESWHGYLAHNLPEMKNVMMSWQGVFLSFMPSVFASLRVLQVDPSTALIVHGVFAAIVFAYCTPAFLRCKDAHLRAILIVTATFAISPYSFLYDAGPLAAAAVLLVGALGKGQKSFVPIAIALLPLAAFPLGLIGLPLAPILITAMLLTVIHVVNQKSLVLVSN